MARKKRENGTPAEEGVASENEPLTDASLEEAEETAPALEQELAAARAEAARNRDLYLRSQADLENYRKRTQREKEELVRFANEGILREILPVVDNLERALEHSGGDAESGLIQGVEMTLGQFRKVLEKFGVTAIEAQGAPFDPALHEAIGQVETSELPPNAVAQVLQKGYLLNERLLRPSLVIVSKAPAAGN